MIKQFDQAVIDALAYARRSIRKIEDMHTLPTKQQLFEIAYLVRSFSALDAAGVFADLDEQADTPKAESILTEVAVKSLCDAPFAQEQRSGRMSIKPPIDIDTHIRGTHT